MRSFCIQQRQYRLVSLGEFSELCCSCRRISTVYRPRKIDSSGKLSDFDSYVGQVA